MVAWFALESAGLNRSNTPVHNVKPSLVLIVLLGLVLRAVVVTAAAVGQAPVPADLPKDAVARLGAPTFVHGGRVHEVFFLGDSQTLFSEAEDGVYFWSAPDGKLLVRVTQESPARRIAQAKATPDGRTIVLTTDHSELGVMNPKKPATIRWLKIEEAYASALAVSNDGKLAATGGGLISADRKPTATSTMSQVMVWDLAAGQVVRRLSIVGSSVPALAFSPDGRRLATSGNRGSTTQLWNLDNGEELRHWDSYAASLAFSPDGRSLAGSMETGGPKGPWHDALKLYDTASDTVRWQLGGTFQQITFSPDGRLLVAGALEGAVVVEASSGAKLHQITYGGNLHVSGLSFSPDGSVLATGADDSRIKVWRTSDWSLISGGAGHDAAAQAVAFSPDGRLIASGGGDDTVRLWSWPEGRQVREFDGVGTHWGVAKLRFSDDGTRLAASAGGNPSFSVWEVMTGTRLSSFGGTGPPYAGLAFLPDHDRLLTSLGVGLVIWDVTTGRQVAMVGPRNGADPLTTPGPPFVPRGGMAPGTYGQISDLALLPGGLQVVWKGINSGIGLQDVATGAKVRTYRKTNGGSRPEEPLLAAPDGSWLLVHDQAWDTASGEIITPDVTIADDSDGGSAMAPDSRLVYRAMADGIHAWERLTAEDIHTFGSPGMKVKGVALSPDGRLLAAACNDGTIVVLEVSKGTAYGLPAEPRSEAEFESLWQIMGGTDHWAANVALWSLARSGQPAVDFLAHKLNPAQPLAPAQVAELRRQLAVTDSPPIPEPGGFSGISQGGISRPERLPDAAIARQTAARTLHDHGVALTPTEADAARVGRTDRYGRANKEGESLPLPDRLRSSRAIGALEHSTAPAAARPLLEVLTAGDAQNPQTIEAASALQFLKRRP